MRTHRKLSIIQYEIPCTIKEQDIILCDTTKYTLSISAPLLSQQRTTEKRSNTYLAIYQSDRKKYLEQSLCDPWVIFHILQSQNPTLLVWHLHSLTPSHWKLGEILPVKQNMDLLITLPWMDLWPSPHHKSVHSEHMKTTEVQHYLTANGKVHKLLWLHHVSTRTHFLQILWPSQSTSIQTHLVLLPTIRVNQLCLACLFDWLFFIQNSAVNWQIDQPTYSFQGEKTLL